RRIVSNHPGHHSPDDRGHRLRCARSVDTGARRRRALERQIRTRGDIGTMKVIIPLAGKGTRLRPHTHLTPKPMLKVAGKPVMSYVLDELKKLGNVEQVIYITRHLKEKVEDYARRDMAVPSVFIEHKGQDRTAGAITHTRA